MDNCNDLYFKNGKMKKKYMMCEDKDYLREVKEVNGCKNIDEINKSWVCAGNRCPYYTHGCKK